jgi:hypothetical protein
MVEPSDIVKKIEEAPDLPGGTQERFAGYGVMAAPFAAGHILCLRRFPASSVGPAYTSVWYRDPEGEWTFFQNAPPAQACPRYFSNALARIVVTNIEIVWTGPRAFSLTMSGGNELSWDVALAATPLTRMMNVIGSLMPERLWQEPAFLKMMGGVARVTLGAGKLALVGKVPNGQGYVVNPRWVWIISSSRATLDGKDLGPMGGVGTQAKLGDFWIPSRGLFAIGRAFFEPFDAARHVPLPAESVAQRG